MLITASHLAKTMGPKTLFTDLSFHVETGEKVALIGRNGQGKTTLLNILHGSDHDYLGELSRQKNLTTVLTSQEHLNLGETSPFAYILASLPRYQEYSRVIAGFESGSHGDLDRYSEAVEFFSVSGYYYIEDKIIGTLADFQLDRSEAKGKMANLSGGEKRFVELVRIMYSGADLMLIDEPTNHMDYAGKARFIEWLQGQAAGMLIVTHDRDVMGHVDRILELKDQKLVSYRGNYRQYLSQNTLATTSSVTLYQNQLKRLAEAKKKVDWGLAMRAKSKAWKIRYDHWKRDYDKIKAATVKPSFWIDQDSVQDLSKNVSSTYHKFKEKNVQISTKSSHEKLDQIVQVRNLSLGYKTPLFTKLAFTIGSGDKLFLKGRNGAGKSTLIKTLLAKYEDSLPPATLLEGEIKFGSKIQIGEYQQEISEEYLNVPLELAIFQVHEKLGVVLGNTQLKGILSRYLFDPTQDGKQRISSLSGGQKARFQLIKMLAGNPSLLLLDEPTNHLDLPSIEELENALLDFPGGILYTSHDSYFIAKMGGEIVQIGTN